MKIEDVARECGLTKRAIRYYEEIGILPPPDRSKGGVRQYNESHIAHLKKILNAREVLGFSLQELQQYIAIIDALENHKRHYKQITDHAARKEKLLEIEHNLNELLELIEQKANKISAVRAELEQLRERARAAIANIENPS
ncbi:MAG TPA: MerR family transcriptional regulator [Bacilli bacterium]